MEDRIAIAPKMAVIESSKLELEMLIIIRSKYAGKNYKINYVFLSFWYDNYINHIVSGENGGENCHCTQNGSVTNR